MLSMKGKADLVVRLRRPRPGWIRFVHAMWPRRISSPDPRWSRAVSGLILFHTLSSVIRATWSSRTDLDIEFPDIAARFAPYLGWLDRLEVLKIHFEDLINDRPATLNRIIGRFLNRVPLPTPRERILDALESSIDPGRSPTFRSGRTGEWRKYFKDEHRHIFKDVAGELLMQLGYEKSNDWE